jgi:hypothetical protein
MKGKPLHRPSLIRRFFSALGPGVIAGAADDDPSGIATYSITGAQLGTSPAKLVAIANYRRHYHTSDVRRRDRDVYPLEQFSLS